MRGGAAASFLPLGHRGWEWAEMAKIWRILGSLVIFITAKKMN
jgi:hypothetical protein